MPLILLVDSGRNPIRNYETLKVKSNYFLSDCLSIAHPPLLLAPLCHENCVNVPQQIDAKSSSLKLRTLQHEVR